MNEKGTTNLKDLFDNELVLEHKKRKKEYTYNAFFIGLMTGGAVWSTVKNGFGFLTFLPLLTIYFFRNANTNYKEIQEEIDDRKNNYTNASQ